MIAPLVSRAEFDAILDRLSRNTPGGSLPVAVFGASQITGYTPDELRFILSRSSGEAVEVQMALRVAPREEVS